MRHDPGSSPHQFAYWTRYGCGAGTLRLLAMPDFVMAHGLDDGPAAQIFGRQLLEVTLQMTFDLPLRFSDEAEAGAVAHQRGEGANAEGSRIPERVQHARAAAQLLEAGLAPGQVVGFLAGGIEHELPDPGISREQGLGVVQRLRGHFPGVVHPHQGGGFAFGLRRKAGIGLLGIFSGGRAGARRGGRYGPASGRRRKKGPEGAIRR
jgi:hypothetical protein